MGEKLVEELNSDESNNTLTRWMAHYIAELIEKVDSATSEEDKKKFKKECCDLILELWSKKDDLPIVKPLDNLKPILEILKILNEEKKVVVVPRWLEYSSMQRENEWVTFVDKVKNNSEIIFNKVVQINLHKGILLKDRKWMAENKEFLSQDEKDFLSVVDVMSKFYKDLGVIDLNDFQISDDNEQRVEEMFDDLEKLLDEQKEALHKVRDSFWK